MPERSPVDDPRATRIFVVRHGTTLLNRENLYDMLSAKGNPRLTSITAILNKLGMEVRFEPKARRKRAA